MNVNPQIEQDQPLMTATVSVRLTQDQRLALEDRASREQRTVSNYVRKHLRTHLEQQRGTER